MKRLFSALFFLLFIVAKILPVTVYCDTPFIKKFISEAVISTIFTDDISKAEISFVNGLTIKKIPKNTHDYTVGIENVVLHGAKTNTDVIYSFKNFKIILSNITEVLALYYPDDEKKFKLLYKKYIQKIDAIQKAIVVPKRVFFRFGYRFDYLFDDFKLKYIDVDESFVSREKAFRDLNVTTIHVCEPMPENMKKGIDSLQAGYLFVDIGYTDTSTDILEILKNVMEEVRR